MTDHDTRTDAEESAIADDFRAIATDLPKRPGTLR